MAYGVEAMLRTNLDYGALQVKAYDEAKVEEDH